MALRIDLQNTARFEAIPEAHQFQRWVEAALQAEPADLEQTVCIVDAAQSRQLNQRFRAKDSPTNVLAFVNDDEHLDYTNLGDLVICAPVVVAEAAAQGKPAEAHWAHMVVHGMLHLQGFDHDDAAQAKQMEALEIKILNTLGYTNPYND